MNKTRTYTMTARAEAAERTRVAILDAAVRLATSRLLADISLDDVAFEAGVSVQTVLRRFGSRAGLIEAAGVHARREVEGERQTPVGDAAAAVEVVVEHYERRGDGVVLLLAQEHTDQQVRTITEHGRRLHREWVEAVFAPHLAVRGDDAEALADLLAVATDVQTWRQLRRDRELDRATTVQRMQRLVLALLSTSNPDPTQE
jgi:AcrR family transcriptional regulator